MVTASTPFAREEVNPRFLVSYVCDSKVFPWESVTAVIRDWVLYVNEIVVRSGSVTCVKRP